MVGGDPASEPVEQPASAPVEEPASAPVEEPADAPVEGPADAPMEGLTDAPVEEGESASSRRRRKKSRRLSRHKQRHRRFRRRRNNTRTRLGGWRGLGLRGKWGRRRRTGRKGRGFLRRGFRQRRRGCGHFNRPIRGGATRTSKRSRNATVLPGEERSTAKKSQAQLYNEIYSETGEIGGSSDDRKKHEEYLADLRREKEALDRGKEAKAKKKAQEEARATAAAATIGEEGQEEEDVRPCEACTKDDGLEMVLCDKKLGDGRCDKCYHLECVGLDQAPEGEVRQTCCWIGCVTRYLDHFFR